MEIDAQTYVVAPTAAPELQATEPAGMAQPHFLF